MIVVGEFVTGMPALRRILLADDEPDIREVSRIALEMVGGCEVEVCSSGFEVLRKVAEFEPDMIVIDVMMPDKGGLEVLEELRQDPRHKDLPIVFLTGVALDSDIQDLRRSGVVEVIRKPFDPMNLANQVAIIWSEIHEQ